jgi:exodeoxyribonuclease VII large subunit
VVASAVPVVTGIGHEPDTSIADMVADLRASTPTAAAEAVAPSCEELVAVVGRERRALGRALQSRVRFAAQSVIRLAERPVLRDPHAVLGVASQAIDIAAMRLSRALPERIGRDSQRLAYARDRLVRSGPRLTERPAADVSKAAARLHDLSPLAILGRGYAVCYAGESKTIVKSTAGVAVGESLAVRVSDGFIAAAVTGKIGLEEQ